MDKKLFTVIGLMSGTSMDGIDVALIKTDGYSHVGRIAFKSYSYSDEVRQALRPCLGLSADKDDVIKKAEQLVTQAHIDAVKDFGHKADLIGFHGQTIFHDPANRMTWQIGDGDALAKAVGMDVIYDFRTADVKAGGQGAPFLPLYHRVLAKSSDVHFPCVILNIGGVANITWIGEGENDILAFDTGPGNALMDDWIQSHTGQRYDENGNIAIHGVVHEDIVQEFLKHPYFARKPLKSLDRDEFSSSPVKRLSLNDGTATLAAMTTDSIMKAFDFIPGDVHAIYVTGGGRHNNFLMGRLAEKSGVKVASVDTLGWDGDAMEAEGFAYLAVRSKLGLPLSLPTTTGVPQPLTGGKTAKAA